MAARARYPFLAANLLDAVTGRQVDWPNVHPSTLTTIAGLRIGIVGAMTIDGLRSTLAANVHGLRLAPLAATVATEAGALRARGADLVLLTIHAGGRCAQFSDPADLSTCDGNAEVVRLLEELPRGTLDAVVAGHTHAGLAHLINGVPVIESLWGGRAFGRMDLSVAPATKHVVGVRLFPPQELCATAGCGEAGAAAQREARDYEGRPIAADPAITQAMAPELARVRRMQAEPLPCDRRYPGTPRCRGRSAARQSIRGRDARVDAGG